MTSAKALAGSVARMAASRFDLILVGMMVLCIGMLVTPLPLWMIDLFLAANLSFTFVVLVIALYMRENLELTTFPAIILIATLFRLALSISTTRMILGHGEAGDIIQSFGDFVVAGNVIVGLVIFTIVTIVQFIVITKGAERIAEVGARFTLDALPGKQMSIDSDLRAENITQQEAQKRRARLEKESQFFGAMDGAMKFVKGDAIAGLVITIVNLLGGLAIGILQQGKSFAEASYIYSLLTVGDGLVAQIPALFVAITSGIVVTRITGEESLNLGQDISKQLTTQPQALVIASSFMFLAGLLPGFPTLFFFALGLGCGLLGLFIILRARRKKHSDDQEVISRERAVAEELPLAKANDFIIVRISTEILTELDTSKINADLKEDRQERLERIGFICEKSRFMVDDAWSAENNLAIEVEGVPILEVHLNPSFKFAIGIDEMGDDVQHFESSTGRLILQLPPDSAELDVPDSQHLSVSELIVDLIQEVEVEYAYRAMDVDAAVVLLEKARKKHNNLVDAVEKAVPAPRLSEILALLLADGISLNQPRLILQTVLQFSEVKPDVEYLADCVRVKMSRQICHQVVGSKKIMPVIVIDTSVETLFRQFADDQTGSVVLPGDMSKNILNNINEILSMVRASRPDSESPKIIAPFEVRRNLQKYLVNNNVSTNVLAYQEVPRTISIIPVATLSDKDFKIIDDPEALPNNANPSATTSEDVAPSGPSENEWEFTY